MDRRPSVKRLTLALLAFALVGLIVRPAVATHITEPTTPVTGLEIRALNYGTSTNIDCSITDPALVTQFPFDAVRIEPQVYTAGKPSEHWSEVGRVIKVTSFSSTGEPRGILDWDMQPVWHNNHAPHKAGFESGQWNTYRLQEDPGFWFITWKVTGLASGNVFTDTCLFKVVVP
jgi:hypothetical protein